MARTLDIESLLEESLVSLLSTFDLSGFNLSGAGIKSWDDNKNAELTPVVKVNATLNEELEGTYNLYAASNITVDFGVFTSKRRDEDGRIGNALRGVVRCFLNQGDIVDQLNQTAGLFVYENGIIPEASFIVEDDKIFQKGISVRVVATTIE